MKLKQFLMALSGTPAFLPTLLVLSLMLLVLTGCGATPVASTDFTPTPVTFTIVVPYSCGQPPSVGVVGMRDVTWDIIELDDESYFALTVDGYKALGLNTSDWIAASREMKLQRDFYRDCIMRSRKEIQDENMDSGLVASKPD